MRESYSRRFKSRKIRSKRRTDGASAFGTRTARGHVLLLDPARGKERLMMIQQHDGVVVDAAELRQGFTKLLREEDEV